MKAQLNSNLFPIISVGMYGSIIAPDSMFDDCQINEDFNEGYIDYDSEYFWDNFDNDAYIKHIQRLADNFLSREHENNGIKITIKTGEIYSPKYYNFTTDNIDLEVKFNKTLVAKYAKDNKKEFNTFLKEHYSSYDGFCSFTANNYDNWLADYQSNEDTAIGAVLSFIFECDNQDYDNFAEYVLENTYYTEFVSTIEIDRETERLNNFVCEQYLTIDLDSFEFTSEILIPEQITRLAKLQFNRISDKSYKLAI